jgi:hypothetical protein
VIALAQYDATDKMERLLAFLSAIDAEPGLAGHMALHGGTAINAFLLDLPRMSVDVDLSYIGEVDRSDLEHVRGDVLDAVSRCAQRMGYRCTYGKDGHAGRTVHMRYAGGEIKADVNFMNRVTAFPPVRRASALDARMTFPTLSTGDLCGGKVRAVLGRAKARDLYDIGSLDAIFDDIDDGYLHGMLLLYATLSEGFPHNFPSSFADGLERRFADLQRDVDESLVPVLKPGSRRPSAEELLEGATSFLSSHVDPRGGDELEFVRLMKEEAVFEPGLILPADAAERAKRFPEAMWKTRNLRRYVELDPADYE